MFHRQPLPPEFGVTATNVVASRVIGGWTAEELVLPEATPAWTQVWFDHLFGLAIFV